MFVYIFLHIVLIFGDMTIGNFVRECCGDIVY